VEFQALFQKHYPPLFRYVHRMTGDADQAEDVAQEAFVRLYGATVPAEDVRPWLFTVATNLVRDGARSRARRRRLLATAAVAAPVAAGADEHVLEEERKAEVRAALDRLSERDRQILLMRAEGFAYREIAEVIGVSTGSVGTLVVRALRRLVEAYESREDGDGAHD
jgi:RNA polymerase sigma-70 factor, ECF subfamily